MRRILIALTLLGLPAAVAGGGLQHRRAAESADRRRGAAPLELAEFKALRDDRRAPYAGKDGVVVVSARGLSRVLWAAMRPRRSTEEDRLHWQRKSPAGTPASRTRSTCPLISSAWENIRKPPGCWSRRPAAPTAAIFMVLANLATAYFLAGQLDRAARLSASGRWITGHGRQPASRPTTAVAAKASKPALDPVHASRQGSDQTRHPGHPAGRSLQGPLCRQGWQVHARQAAR